MALSQFVFAEVPNILGIIRSDTNLTNFGYRIVPLGDQNNDGFDDIVIWDYRFSSYIYYGGNPFDTIPVLRIDSVNGRISNIGDINGDNFNDFTMLGRSPYGWKLNAYYGGPDIDTLRDLWFGSDTLNGQGYTVNGNDINRNGSSELISWWTNNKGLLLFELGNDSDSIPELLIKPPNLTSSEYSAFGEGITTGDFNGDGINDLAANLRPKFQQHLNGSVYIYFGGSAFDTIPEMIITRPGEHITNYENFGVLLENLGDINGDNYDDLYIGSNNGSDSLDFIYFGGPYLDTIPDILFYYDEALHVRSAGDVNNDGHKDLIVSYHSSWSGLGHIHIYLGGPDIDSIPDLSIYNNDIDGFQVYFGMDCAGIGDFNGDGIDDYAFSAIDSRNVGHVYICSGWDVTTDANEDQINSPPAYFILSENYPNPFNPSTIIEFELPRHSHVELSIYNILGKKIATLINKELSAGSHKINWDGRDKFGNPVSTGIYFYNLSTDDFSETKKMVLLK